MAGMLSCHVHCVGWDVCPSLASVHVDVDVPHGADDKAHDDVDVDNHNDPNC